MKKISIILALALSSTMQAKDQEPYQLLHVFNQEGMQLQLYDYDNNKSLMYQDNDNTSIQGKYYYCTNFNSKTGVYKVINYNYDFTPMDSSEMYIPALENHTISSYSASKHIFNDDNQTEMLVTYVVDDAYINTVLCPECGSKMSYNYLRHTLLYDSKGNVIFDFGYGFSLIVSSYLHVYNNQYRLWVTRLTYPSEDAATYQYSYEVWSVNKKNSTGLKEVKPEDLPRKFLRDGQIFIQIGDKQYNIEGIPME